MKFSSEALPALLVLWLVNAEPTFAQISWPPYPTIEADPHYIDRGAGGYFSWIKLLMMIVMFLAWVRIAEWVNRDAIRFAEFTNQPAKIWNPILVFTFLAGFVAVLTIPVFIAGYAIYVIAAALPFTIYMVQRRGKIPESEKTGELFSEKITELNLPIKFKAAGSNDEQSQSNLIRARQSPAFEQAAQMLYDTILRRGDQILLDYSPESAAIRMQVDGMWHTLPTMDRESGDAMLFSLKHLAGLNPAERRQQQRGEFEAAVGRHDIVFDMTSQGVATGERVLFKIIREETLQLELDQLGMPADMVESLSKILNGHGYIIISAPNGAGLSSTWQATLNQADRFTRDWIAIVDHDDRETERENVEINRIDTRRGETPMKLLKSILLRQPSGLVIPNPVDAATLDLLTLQAAKENRTVLSRLNANSAAEALLRLMSVSGNRQQFVRAMSAVTCQRLVRRLCESCKQPMQANPKAIQQMGGNPQENTIIHVPYQLPPPEQRVDEQGRPIEIEPCRACGGIGYIGRIAIYELILVDDAIRQVMLSSPKVDSVAQISRKQGNLTLVEQGYRSVLAGATSMAEIQRVLQSKS